MHARIKIIFRDRQKESVTPTQWRAYASFQLFTLNLIFFHSTPTYILSIPYRYLNGEFIAQPIITFVLFLCVTALILLLDLLFILRLNVKKSLKRKGKHFYRDPPTHEHSKHLRKLRCCKRILFFFYLTNKISCMINHYKRYVIRLADEKERNITISKICMHSRFVRTNNAKSVMCMVRQMLLIRMKIIGKFLNNKK